MIDELLESPLISGNLNQKLLIVQEIDLETVDGVVLTEVLNVKRVLLERIVQEIIYFPQ